MQFAYMSVFFSEMFSEKVYIIASLIVDQLFLAAQFLYKECSSSMLNIQQGEQSNPQGYTAEEQHTLITEI